MTYKLKPFAFLLILFLPSSLWSKDGVTVKSYEIGVPEGISNVTCSIEDREGFIWTGTWGGLYRYDGREITAVGKGSEEGFSLSSGTVIAIKDQGDGKLWVLTHFGINRFDTHNGKIRQFFPRKGEDWDYLACSSDISPNGLALFSLTDRICYYDEFCDSIIRIPVRNLPDEDIRSIAWLDDDEFFIRYSNDKVSLAKTEFKGGKPAEITLSDYQQGYGTLNLKSHKGNVYLIKKDTLSVINREKKSGNIKLPCEGIRDISLRDDGEIAICDDYKVWTIDPESKEPAFWYKSAERISSISWGRQNILWVSSESGLAATYSDTRNFKSVNESDRNKIGEIWCLGEDDRQNIYIGSKNGLFTLKEGKAADVPDLTGKIKGRGVRYFKPLKDGRYALSTSTGVNIVEMNNGVITRACQSSESDPFIFEISEGKDRGTIWTASFVNGLKKHIYESRNGELEFSGIRSISPGLSENGISGRVGQGVEYDRKDDIIWYGTHMGGLFALEGDSEEFKNVPLCAPYASSCIDTPIIRFNNDSSILYSGTSCGLMEIRKNSSGVYELTPVKDLKGSILENKYIGTLAFDRNSGLWTNISSSLVRYDSDDGSVTTYEIDDYISYGRISNFASFCSSDGTMYFGGNTGLMWFNPDEIRTSLYSPEVRITSLTAKNTAITDYMEEDSVILPYSGNFFTVKFNAIDYINNKKCSYSYMLEGFDKTWNEIGRRNDATFTNVPPGKYNFLVKCSNGENQGKENITKLTITVLSPWWSSTLAIISYVVLVTEAILLSFLSIRRRMKNKREMEMIELKQKQEEEKFEAKLDFFTNVANEFGTPLTIISGSAGQLKDDIRLPRDIQSTISSIQSNSRRLQKLIQELLNFRKISTGKYLPHYSTFNLSSLLSDITDNFREKARVNNISFELSLPKKAGLVTSDYDALEKIFYNLISNAFKYTPKGGRIEIMLNLEDGISFSIGNTGEGISEKDIPKIFDRYEILDKFEKKASEESGGRNGIGLALVKSLIDALSGTISVSSEENKYTLFTFKIPKVIISESREMPAEENSSAESRPFDINIEKPSILVVDDEKDVRELIRSLLCESYNIILARNGYDALEKLKNSHANLIITDKIMPRMGGIELIEKLKGNSLLRHIPVIAMSFKTEDEDEAIFYRMGVENFVQKPFNPTTFKALVSKTLNTRSELKSFYSSSASNIQLLKGKVVNSEDKSFMLNAIQIIEQNIADDTMSPGFVAERMNISEIKLYRKIKEVFHMTSVEFIRHIKLNHAALLLKTSSLTIQEVMYNSGFNNRSYFHKKFSEMFGVTPTVYREQHKE